MKSITTLPTLMPKEAAPTKRQTTHVPSQTPTLESIAQEICLDARHDSMKYLLRSDTSHDGE